MECQTASHGSLELKLISVLVLTALYTNLPVAQSRKLLLRIYLNVVVNGLINNHSSNPHRDVASLY